MRRAQGRAAHTQRQGLGRIAHVAPGAVMGPLVFLFCRFSGLLATSQAVNRPCCLDLATTTKMLSLKASI
ncbi:hypothetical protein L484_025690 [Morus notabilis]|uniref:Uncharacterized protein n=1 Tax=Morus notabilis TaxID=981085 RepID=W9R3L5_9ROSA|nr:hypothetical protein L484_025690 [Morus notabilis]